VRVESFSEAVILIEIVTEPLEEVVKGSGRDRGHQAAFLFMRAM
jgi:hypothetical protein